MALITPGSESDKIRQALERDSARLNKDMLDDLLKAAKRWRPSDYDDYQKRLRHYYEGKQESYTRAALRARYENTADAMHVSVFNYTRRVAEVDASVYDYPPTRRLVRVGVEEQVGEQVEGEESVDEDLEQRQTLFDDLLEKAKVNVVMMEGERRVSIARTVILHPYFDTYAGHAKLQVRWPHEVLVVPYWRRPESIETAVAVLVRVAGPSGGQSDKPEDRWWQVWTRPYSETVDSLELGSISVEMVNEKGDSFFPFGSDDAEYELERMPFVTWTIGMPEGSPFLDVDRDIIPNQDAINTNWSNFNYIMDYQAHDELFVVTNQDKPSTLAAGPGLVHLLRSGEDIRTVTRNPKLSEMLDGIDRQVKTLALTRGQPEDAYSIDGGTVLSGVSRLIKNEHAMKRRRENISYARAVEMQLLPMLVEIQDTWGGTSIGGPDIGYTFEPQEPDEFEETSVKQDRITSLVDKGYVSQARGAVMLGLYATEEDAAKAGLSTEIRKQASTAFAGGITPLSARLDLANRNSPLTDDEPANEDDEG